MKKNLTEIVFILDRSGSMAGLEAPGGRRLCKGKQVIFPGRFFQYHPYPPGVDLGVSAFPHQQVRTGRSDIPIYKQCLLWYKYKSSFYQKNLCKGDNHGKHSNSR